MLNSLTSPQWGIPLVTPIPIAMGAEGARLLASGPSSEEPDYTVHALDDNCTHEECPLSDGILTDTELTCFCHGSVFDVRTGEALVGPALESVRVFPARIAGGSIEVEV